MKTAIQERARHRYKTRRVVGGLAYDTETASCVAFWDCTEWGPNVGEDLYVNVRGHYFVVRHDEDEVHWDDHDSPIAWAQFLKVTPLTREQAIAWAEKYCWHMVEELFGRMPEPGEGEPYQALP